MLGGLRLQQERLRNDAANDFACPFCAWRPKPGIVCTSEWAQAHTTRDLYQCCELLAHYCFKSRVRGRQHAKTCLQVSCARALSRAARASPNGTDITADTLALILRGAQFAISDVDVERLCRTCPGSTANTVDHREFVRWLDTAPSLATGRPTADRLEDTLTTASPWQVRLARCRAMIAATTAVCFTWCACAHVQKLVPCGRHAQI